MNFNLYYACDNCGWKITIPLRGAARISEGERLWREHMNATGHSDLLIDTDVKGLSTLGSREKFLNTRAKRFEDAA